MQNERYNQLIKDPFFKQVEMAHHCTTWKKDYIDYKSGKIWMTYDQAVEFTNEWKEFPQYRECINIINAKNHRYSRLLKRISMFLETGTCYFVTLTWRDDILQDPKKPEEVRRRYVRRFLKKIAPLYIANIDFGDQTQREHYHAVIRTDDPDEIQTWPYGFVNVQKIRYDRKSMEKISHYVTKLANHAKKDSTQNRRVIYSVYRDFWKYKEPVKPAEQQEDQKDLIEQMKLWKIVPGDVEI